MAQTRSTGQDRAPSTGCPPFSTTLSTPVSTRSPHGNLRRGVARTVLSGVPASSSRSTKADRTGRTTRGPHLWTTLWVCGWAPRPSSERTAFPPDLWTTGGQPVHGTRCAGDRRHPGCGGPVGGDRSSTPGASSSADRSTRHTQGQRAADLRRRESSTVPTPPTTMMRSLNSAIPPRVPTRPDPLRQPNDE